LPFELKKDSAVWIRIGSEEGKGRGKGKGEGKGDGRSTEGRRVELKIQRSLEREKKR
jgi:hypothetical protein